LCLAEEFWMAKPCCRGYRHMYGYREGPRDQVAVEGNVVRYLLWGNEIANWNRKKGTLIVDDCGWQTQLTMNRLNGILQRLHFSIYSERGTLYLHDWKRGETYLWEGSHVIDLESRQVVPCTPRKFNEKISNSLKEYYKKARRIVEEKKFLSMVTLDGLIFVFVRDGLYGLSENVLGLQIYEDGFKAYEGSVAVSKIYSAFMKRNAWIIMRQLVEEGDEIEGAEDLLRKLKEFNADLNVLPECVVSNLALAKLLGE